MAISHSIDVRSALRRQQRGFILDPFKFGAPPVTNTWNPSDKDADVSLSGGDLVASVTQPGSSVFGSVRAITPRDASLNKYFEVTLAGGTSIASTAGIASVSANLGTPATGAYFYGPFTNQSYVNGSPTGGYLAANTVVGVLVDFGAGTITLKRAGKFYTSAFSSISGTLYPMWGPGTSGAGTRTATINTGGSAWVLGLPPGATAWGGTWNSADKSASVTLSGSDLIASTTTSTGGVRGTQGRSSGVYYFEVTQSGADNNQIAGVGKSTANISFFPGLDADGWGYYFSADQKYTNGGGTAMPGIVASTTIGVWMNAGAVACVGEGMAGGSIASSLSGNYYPFWYSGAGAAGTYTGTLNVGDTAFVWPLPSGASAWG